MSAWSSGESEPEEEYADDRTGASQPNASSEIFDDPERDDGVFFDSVYFSSIKDFVGHANFYENIPIPEHTPLAYFEFFMDSNIFKVILEQTNLFQKQNPDPFHSNMAPWKDVTVEELRIFLALTINMGHVRKCNVKDYWSMDPLLSTPIFRKYMTRNRYLQILRFLHFENNRDNASPYKNHPLRKIKPVIDFLNQKFSSTLHPGKNLCIDESLMLWKGRLKFKQYLPLKRHRFGIKFFELVDCETGFLLRFIIYTGADTDYEKFDLGISGDIVVDFLTPYFNKGHVIFIDNWYSSPQLANFLHDKDTGMCGTVKKTRKGMPKLVSKLNRGEIEVAHTDSWLAIKWMDKKEVYMITTVHEVGYASTGKKHWSTNKDIIKPICIVDYNKNMGGIDNIDRQLSLAETIRKSTKWYRKLFFHLLDFVLVNSHALHKMKSTTNKKISYPDFRLEVVRGLLGINSDDLRHSCQSNDSRLTGKHFPKKIDQGKKKEGNCCLCLMNKTRHRSTYECKTCQVVLCIDPCFETYHTKEVLP